MNTSYPAQALHNEKATDSSGSASNFKFRLVRICPATTRGAPVKCTLENMTLGNSEVDYNALSYNWGEKQNNAKIQLSGQPYFVTKNLYLALRHIRDPQKHQLFFIDALCINQNDVEERSSQVQRMFDVYRNATQVVVFLGEQRENTAQALSWITSAGEDLDLSRFDIIKGVAARTFAPSSSDQILIHQGLRDIMSRPWWRRIWIVQELAVAGDALIQCGSCTTSWRYWDLVIDGYQAAVLDPPRGIHLFSWMPPFRHSQYPGQVLLHPELSNTIDWAAACALHTATRRCQDSEVDHGLASLLIRFRDFLCSDPRDKIYAIFRLSKESAHIKPDYSKSVAEVYMEAVQNSVKNPFQRLALFSMLDYEHRDTTLPSWCPSLHAPAPNGRPFYRDGFLSAQRHYTIPEFEGRTMTVSGFTINRIASIVTSDTSSPDPVTSSSPCEALHNPSSPLLDPLKTLCISLGDISWIKDQQFRLATPSSELSDALSARSDYFSQRSDSSQPWYSPEVLDSNAAWEYTSREDRIYAENWVQIILKDGKTGRYYDQVIPKANLKEICKAASRRIVLCIDGSYAHVPLSAEIGDQLVVFLGGKVPFCIRKVNEGLEYHLIGDCYVHGYMAGEAIPATSKEFEAQKKYFKII